MSVEWQVENQCDFFLSRSFAGFVPVSGVDQWQGNEQMSTAQRKVWSVGKERTDFLQITSHDPLIAISLSVGLKAIEWVSERYEGSWRTCSINSMPSFSLSSSNSAEKEADRDDEKEEKVQLDLPSLHFFLPGLKRFTRYEWISLWTVHLEKIQSLFYAPSNKYNMYWLWMSIKRDGELTERWKEGEEENVYVCIKGGKGGRKEESKMCGRWGGRMMFVCEGSCCFTTWKGFQDERWGRKF